MPYLFPLPGLIAGVAPAMPAATTARAGLFAYDTMTLVGPGTWEAAVDVAITATELVLAGAPVAYACCRPPGHHATPTCFGGSCYLNNTAAAAAHLARGAGGPVAVLDLDAHHGNGTQTAFYDRADVLVGSVHVDPGAGWFPHFLGFAAETGAGPGHGANRNLPLAPGAGDVVTHDLGLAWNVADRVAVIYLGRIVEQGTTEDLLTAPRHPYTRALLSVVPEVARMEAQILTGEAPDPTRIPPGCRFHPRCPLVASGEAARLGIEARCRGEDLASSRCPAPLRAPVTSLPVTPSPPPVSRSSGGRCELDAALSLVHRRGRSAARARAAVRRRVAVRRAHGRAGRARLVPHLPRGPSADRRRPRPRGRRVCQRVPPPRRGGRVGRGALHDAAVPLPRVDVWAGRLAARGATREPPRGGLRPGGARPAPRAAGEVGGVRVRQRRSRRGAAGRHAGRAARARAACRPRRRHARLPLPRPLLASGQLEGRGRELPRVLPLRGRPPELQRRGRRRAGHLPPGDPSQRSPATTRARARARR